MAVEDNGKLKFQAEIDTKKFSEGLNKIGEDLKGLGNQSTKTDSVIKKNNDSTAKSFLGLGNSVKGLGSIFTQLAGSFGVFAGIGAIVGVITNGIRSIGQFDKSMTNLAAIAGVSRDSIQGLESDIRSIASESINSANQVADMAMELIKLGSTPDAVRNLLKPVNDLSIAFQASADSVAVLLKGTLNAFGESEDQATRYADVMAMSANKTALGFNEISDAFTYIASSASAMGYSIEQTSAMMGILVDNNVQASSAGRVLSSTFGRLAKEGKTLESQLELVANAEDKMAVSAKIFGAEGARLGLILANNTDKMNELTKSFENAEGSLAKLTEAQLDSVSATFQIMLSSIEEMFLSIDNGNGMFSKFVKNVLDGVSSVANFFAAINRTTTVGSIKLEQEAMWDNLTAITKLNVGSEERIELIKQLKSQYPEYLSSINAETLTNKELSEAMKLVNDSYAKRILLQEKVDKAELILGSKREFETLELRKQNAIIERINKVNAKYGVAIEIDPNDLKKSVNEALDVLALNNAVKLPFTLRGDLSGDIADLESYRGVVDILSKDYDNATDAVKRFKKENNMMTEEGRKQLQEYRDYFENTVMSSLGNKEKNKGVIETTQEQLALLEKLSKIERTMNDSVLDERELALSRITEKYRDLVKEAQKLGMSDSKIKKLEQQEIQLTTYKIDTNDLITSLNEQERLYREYQSSINNIGLEGANKMYADLIDINKSYFDLIQDEMNKIDFNTLTDKERNRLDELGRLALDYGDAEAKQDRDRYEKLIKDTQSVSMKLLDIKKRYEADRLQIIKQFEGEEQRERLEVNDTNYSNQFNALSESVRKDASSYVSVLESISGATKRQVEAQIIQLNRFLKANENLSDEQRKATELAIKRLNSALVGATDDRKNRTQLSVINSQIAVTKKQIEELEQSFKNLNREQFLTQKDYENAVNSTNNAIKILQGNLDVLHVDKFEAIMQDIGSLGDSFGTFADSIQNVNPEIAQMFRIMQTGIKIMDSISKIISAVGSGLRSAGEGGGNMWVAIAGAVLEIVGAVAQMWSGISEETKRTREQLRQYNEGLLTGEYAYQRLLRERKFNNIGRGKDRKTGLQDEIDLIESSMPDIQKEFDYYLNRIQSDGEKVLRKWRSHSFWRSTTKTEFGDLIGVDFDELEKLDAMGKLEGQTKQWFDELKKLRDELEETGIAWEDLQQQMDEMLTGTTAMQLSDMFANMFANGTNSAYNFAATLEDVIRTAIVAGFQANFIDKEMQSLFDKLAKASEDGELTQKEIDEITKDAMDRLEKLQKEWERITGNLDMDFGGTNPQDNGRDTVKRITEQQADLMTGAILGMQVIVIENSKLLDNAVNILSLNNQLITDSYVALVNIEKNTYHTWQGVEGLRGDVQQLQVVMKDNQNRALGL